MEDHLMEGQMPQRTFSKHQQPQEEQGKEAEGIVKTLFQAITEQDKTRVAAMAYTLYEQRGREDGHDLDDRLEAERRIVSPGLSKGF
jgi:hypothetical protein